MNQHVILNTPSGAIIQLSFFKTAGRFCAALKINNTVAARVFGTHTVDIDGNDLILNDTHLQLLPESLPVATEFVRETLLSLRGDQ